MEDEFTLEILSKIPFSLQLLDVINRVSKKLVAEIVSRLENIPDGGAESFPFELIDELKEEYLSD